MSEVVYTPGAINKYLKSKIESDKYLSFCNIKGEVSNLKYHTNNNIYFCIKDEDASIDCICFSHISKTKLPKLSEGMQIQVVASVYLYIKAGKYNLNVSSFKKLGEGELFERYLKLKFDLEKEGLFLNKQQIPKFSNNIGVITSKTSAALQDILATIKQRNSSCNITVFNTLVQGHSAILDIVNNLKLADTYGFDCLIVGRGGGSIEDLWAFNEKEVAYAVNSLNTPVISCVGHETDTTIIDFVADYRAPTPTAAATKATFDLSLYKKDISSFSITINNLVKTKLDFEQMKLTNLINSQYLLNPLLSYNMSYDNLKNKFVNNIKDFEKVIALNSNKLENNLHVIEKGVMQNINKNITRLNHTHEMLDNLNPLSILSRGYSLSYLNDEPIKSISQVKVTDEIKVNLADGQFSAKIKEINEKI